MKGKYIAIIAVFGFIVFFFSMEARAAEWKYIFKASTGGEWFYDTQSISRGKDVTSVWTKWILSDKERAKFIKDFPKEFKITETTATGADTIINKGVTLTDISFFIEKEEINCSKNVARIMSMSLYSSDGEVIWSSGTQKPNQFEDVFPDSKGVTLVKAICGEGEGGK